MRHLQFRLVGLYSRNRYEWVIAEQACNAYGLTSVPLYDTLGADAVAFVIGQTRMVTVFVEAAALPMVRVQRLGRCLRGRRVVWGGGGLVGVGMGRGGGGAAGGT